MAQNRLYSNKTTVNKYILLFSSQNYPANVQILSDLYLFDKKNNIWDIKVSKTYRNSLLTTFAFVKLN
jgi:hypothetical protein